MEAGAEEQQQRLRSFLAGWPCSLARDEHRGRHLVASEDLREGQVVLVSEAYLTALLSSHRKRVCAACLRDARARLDLCCRACNQVWYCSDACRLQHAEPPATPRAPQAGTARPPQEAGSAPCACQRADCSEGQQAAPASGEAPCALHAEASAPAHASIASCASSTAVQPALAAPQCGARPGEDEALQNGDAGRSVLPAPPPPAPPAPRVPHGLVCGVLALFGGSKCDADMEAVLRMCLDAQALRLLQRDAGLVEGTFPEVQCTAPPPLPLPPGAALPALGDGDLRLLQSHARDMTERERKDWMKGMKFLAAAMQRARWPGPIPSPEELLDTVGRIAANNFGIYTVRTTSASAAASAAAGVPSLPATAAEPAAGTPSSQGSPAPAPGSEVRRVVGDGCAAPAGPCLPAARRPIPAWPALGQAAADGRSLSAAHPEHDNPSRGPANPDAAVAAEQLHSGRQSSSGGAEAGPAEDSACCPPPQTPVATAQLEQLRLADSASSVGAPDSGVACEARAQGLGCPLVWNPAPAPPGQQRPAADAAAAATSASASPLEAAEPAAAVHNADSALEPALPDELAPHVRDELLGRQLYISASLFNHSCAPNCLVSRGTGWAVITAQHDVPAGEELTISYIDLDVPRSARRDALRAGFFFDCACARCQQEARDGSAKVSYARSSAGASGGCAPKRRGRKARVSR